MIFVYAILTQPIGGTRFVKFGLTRDMADRVANLQTGCPLPFARAWYVACQSQHAAVQLEAALLNEHADRSTAGEWIMVENDGHAESDARLALESVAAREIGGGTVIEHPLPLRTLGQSRRVGRLHRRSVALGVVIGDQRLPVVKHKRRRNGG